MRTPQLCGHLRDCLWRVSLSNELIDRPVTHTGRLTYNIDVELIGTWCVVRGVDRLFGRNRDDILENHKLRHFARIS